MSNEYAFCHRVEDAIKHPYTHHKVFEDVYADAFFKEKL